MQLIILCGLTNIKQQDFIEKIFANNNHLSQLSSALTSVTSKEKVNSAHTTKKLVELYKQNQTKLNKQFNESVLFHFEEKPEQLNELNFGDLTYKVLYFYNAPERYIASSLSASSIEANSLEENSNDEQALKQWNKSAKTMLAKFIEHIDNAMLFNTHQVLLNANSFASLLEEQLMCEINQLETISVEELQTSDSTLTMEQAFSVLESSQETQNLFEQLESAAELLDQSCDSSIEYRKAQWMSEVILLAKSLVKQNAELAKSHACTKQSEEIQALKQSNTALTAENELSLLQIHQLQEELEVSHVNLKQAQNEITKLNSDKEKVHLALRDESAKNYALTEENKALIADNELSLLQIHQLQEELEQSIITMSNTTENDDQFKARINKLERDYSELLVVNTDLSAENDLSLLQIHQLQEELEHFYVKAQQGSQYSPIVLTEHDENAHLTCSMQLLKAIN